MSCPEALEKWPRFHRGLIVAFPNANAAIGTPGARPSSELRGDDPERGLAAALEFGSNAFAGL